MICYLMPDAGYNNQKFNFDIIRYLVHKSSSGDQFSIEVFAPDRETFYHKL